MLACCGKREYETPGRIEDLRRPRRQKRGVGRRKRDSGGLGGGGVGGPLIGTAESSRPIFYSQRSSTPDSRVVTPRRWSSTTAKEYNEHMDLSIRLPDEGVEVLGPEPEREALEGVLLLLVGEGKLGLERAGGIRGLGGREEAARWYARRALSRLDVDADGGTDEDEGPVFLENLAQERPGRSRRFLKIRPAAEGSGLSDVSLHHDGYLAEDDRGA